MKKVKAVKVGRPTMLLWDRLVTKIQVGESLDLARSLPSLVGTPATAWPTIYNQPWWWIGSTIAPDKNRGRAQARFKVNGRQRGVHRILYELLIRVLEPHEQLVTEVHPLDVNPLHYNVRVVKDPTEYNFTPRDFEDLPPPLELDLAPPTLTVGDRLPQSELQDLADQIERDYARRPFHTMVEFHERFEFMVFDVCKEDIELAIKLSGLEGRIRP